MNAWWIVFTKELVDVLRDRRTLVAMVFVPMVLYPAVLLLTTETVARQQQAAKDRTVRVGVGTPLTRDVLDPLAGDSKAMMDFLRKATYELSPDPVGTTNLGFEFEERHRA